jgi:hypothetical protein
MEETVIQAAKVDKVEQPQNVIVGVDRSYEQVLQLNADPSVVLEWQPMEGAFKRLPAYVVEKLTPGNMRNYLVAETKFDAVMSKVVKVVTNPFNPLMSDSAFREKIRARKGWHQCWAGPGGDAETKLAGPYKQVRKPTEAQEKKGYEPGEEEGEILKRNDGMGNLEAIAVEVPEHLFKEYLEWMSVKSRGKKTEMKEQYFGKVEDINRDLPRDKRIVPIDDEKEVQV